MKQMTLLERLEAVPEGAAFVYKSGALQKIRRGAGALCAEAAREIRRLKSDVAHWMAARHAAIAGGEILYEELDSLRGELEKLNFEMKTALDEVERERDAYLKALKEIADEQFGTVDECIEFADRCIRQMGGYRVTEHAEGRGE